MRVSIIISLLAYYTSSEPRHTIISFLVLGQRDDLAVGLEVDGEYLVADDVKVGYAKVLGLDRALDRGYDDYLEGKRPISSIRGHAMPSVIAWSRLLVTLIVWNRGLAVLLIGWDRRLALAIIAWDRGLTIPVIAFHVAVENRATT